MKKPTTILVWIPGDQLLAEHPALEQAIAQVGMSRVRVLLIESQQRALRLPYHRQKIVLLFSAMRHYADHLRQRGINVDYIHEASFSAAIVTVVAQHHPGAVWMMQSAEFRTRRAQQRLEDTLPVPVRLFANTQFLVGEHNPFPSVPAGKRVVMEPFYRAMRTHFGVLMTAEGGPAGGRWNYDEDNRKPLPRGLTPPALPHFVPDVITREVLTQVNSLPRLTGTTEGFGHAVTHEQAQAALDDFIAHRLPWFGDYEDAMSAEHDTLFHSVLSPYLNIGLLTPMQLIRAAERAFQDGLAPLNAAEGFVRQVLGWREYIYWQYWRQMPDLLQANDWDAQRGMPAMFWTGETDMACLRHVTTRLLRTGYSHHIERLMLICNFCLLAGVHPLAVSEWFLSMYLDAYEWVVLPNVIGMGLNADGGRTATKPYIASASYIRRMSNYCRDCHFKPDARTGPQACPFNLLYWNFVITHEDRLRQNPRSGKAVLGLRHLSADERAAVQEQAADVLSKLEVYENPLSWLK